jgi:hypothetical protein
MNKMIWDKETIISIVRCPKCKEWLPDEEMTADVCPKCFYGPFQNYNNRYKKRHNKKPIDQTKMDMYWWQYERRIDGKSRERFKRDGVRGKWKDRQ